MSTEGEDLLVKDAIVKNNYKFVIASIRTVARWCQHSDDNMIFLLQNAYRLSIVDAIFDQMGRERFARAFSKVADRLTDLETRYVLTNGMNIP